MNETEKSQKLVEWIRKLKKIKDNLDPQIDAVEKYLAVGHLDVAQKEESAVEAHVEKLMQMQKLVLKLVDKHHEGLRIIINHEIQQEGELGKFLRQLLEHPDSADIVAAIDDILQDLVKSTDKEMAAAN